MSVAKNSAVKIVSGRAGLPFLAYKKIKSSLTISFIFYSNFDIPKSEFKKL